MPLEFFETGDKRAWAMWRITESESELEALLNSKESVPDNVTNDQKRREWLTGRLLIETLVDNFGFPYRGITKNEFGKPFLRSLEFSISLTHSFPFVAAILDKQSNVGIDLEQPKEKLLRVAARVLSPTEVNDAGTDLVKHCIYWCAKETLIKIHGKKELTLANQLLIDPFELAEEGNLIGRIIVPGLETVVHLYYRVFKEFVVVFNREL